MKAFIINTSDEHVAYLYNNDFYSFVKGLNETEMKSF